MVTGAPKIPVTNQKIDSKTQLEVYEEDQNFGYTGEDSDREGVKNPKGA